MTEKPDRLIKSAVVCDRTSLSRSTVWRLVKKAQFPAPLPISIHRVAWSEREVSDWIANRVAQCGER